MVSITGPFATRNYFVPVQRHQFEKAQRVLYVETRCFGVLSTCVQVTTPAKGAFTITLLCSGHHPRFSLIRLVVLIILDTNCSSVKSLDVVWLWRISAHESQSKRLGARKVLTSQCSRAWIVFTAESNSGAFHHGSYRLYPPIPLLILSHFERAWVLFNYASARKFLPFASLITPSFASFELTKEDTINVLAIYLSVVVACHLSLHWLINKLELFFQPLFQFVPK